MRTTETETHKAAKFHVCDWCGKRIERGENYSRYRYFDGGDASTVKLHPECYTAMNELAVQEGGIEFGQGDHPRGCNCAFDSECQSDWCKARRRIEQSAERAGETYKRFTAA